MLLSILVILGTERIEPRIVFCPESQSLGSLINLRWIQGTWITWGSSNDLAFIRWAEFLENRVDFLLLGFCPAFLFMSSQM